MFSELRAMKRKMLSKAGTCRAGVQVRQAIHSHSLNVGTGRIQDGVEGGAG